MLKPFPKIFTIGQKYIKDIFEGNVEITEKVDGSQFVFGKVNNQLFFRSKGAVINPEVCPNLFKPAVDYVLSIQDRFEPYENFVVYSETLSKPKHNTLSYSRVPKNHIAIYGVSDGAGEVFLSQHVLLQQVAAEFDVDVVPLLFYGNVHSPEGIRELLDLESFLGGEKIEGIVVKNFNKTLLVGDQVVPLMSGKLVSERFKERHKSWPKEHTPRGKFDTFKESFRTNARWIKAIQRLGEDGKLEESPKDIGILLKYLHQDLEAEQKEDIKEELYNLFIREIKAEAVKGFPEFYKEYLVNKNVEFVEQQ